MVVDEVAGRGRRERNYHLRIVRLWGEQERIRRGEMSKEIEGKKRRDRNTEGREKKAKGNKEMMRWLERKGVCVGVCVSFVPHPCWSIHKGQ